MNEQLWDAPPRICDLPRDQLQEQLYARHAQHREKWLHDRVQKSWLERLLDWVRP